MAILSLLAAGFMQAEQVDTDEGPVIFACSAGISVAVIASLVRAMWIQIGCPPDHASSRAAS
eukprot:7989070-Alexandrium_andersonii.AAC.1